MPTSLNALGIRRRLNELDDQPRHWIVPEPFGPDGWRIQAKDDTQVVAEVIATVADIDVPHYHDGSYVDLGNVEFIHASLVVLARMPSYEEMVLLHQAVFGENRWSYQVFTPVDSHINIHPGALHLWGRLDGRPMLPDFGAGGSI